MRRVVFSQKGGVGKSSIAANLAAIGAQRGRKVLLIDLDPQGNATQYLLGDGAAGLERHIAGFFEKTLTYRLLAQNLGEQTTATPFENLHVVASSADLGALQAKLEAKYKIYKLRESLESLDGTYDDVYIDTPPALNFFTLSALIAADTCLIPFDCDDFSRRALMSVLDVVEETRADHNEGLTVEGIVVNQFLPRANLPKRLVEALSSEGLPILDTKLSFSVRMRESHEHSLPLIHHSPKHKLTTEFVRLYEELEARKGTAA